MKGASRLDGRFAPDRQPRTSVRNTNAETFPRRGLPSDETRQRRAASVDFGEVSRVLMADAAFSSQVLRVANSALFGARYEVASILQALCVLGVDRLRDLVVTVALKDYVGR